MMMMERESGLTALEYFSSVDEVDDGQGLSHVGEPYTGEINDKTL